MRPATLDEHAGDRRVADAAEADDQILDLAEALAVGVAQRAADDRGEVQDRRRLGGGRAHAVIVRRLIGPASWRSRRRTTMLSRWCCPSGLSIAVLSLVQGALVALPGALALPRLARLRGRRWALIPPLSVIGLRARSRARPNARARRASPIWRSCAVPPLAALALGWLARGARAALARAARAAAVRARVGRPRRPGGGDARRSRSRRSAAWRWACCSARVTPPRWLAAGIVAMALADTRARRSPTCCSARTTRSTPLIPAAGLPRLQSAVFGSAVMGYGDLFIAGVLGGLLAATAGALAAAARGAR